MKLLITSIVLAVIIATTMANDDASRVQKHVRKPFIPNCKNDPITADQNKVIQEAIDLIKTVPQNIFTDTKYNQGPMGNWNVIYGKVSSRKEDIFYYVGINVVGNLSDFGVTFTIHDKEDLALVNLRTSPPIQPEIVNCLNRSNVIVTAGPKKSPPKFVYLIATPLPQIANCMKPLPSYTDEENYAVIPYVAKVKCVVKF